MKIEISQDRFNQLSRSLKLSINDEYIEQADKEKIKQKINDLVDAWYK